MFSISPGASPPDSPIDEMCTKAKSRVRAWPITQCLSAPKLLAPASPADTPVVVAVIGTSSSAGRPMAPMSGP